jgi:hypothetical protein
MHPINDFPLFRHGWLLLLASNIVNALMLKYRSRSLIRQKPELAAGYRLLFKGVLFWGSLPWLVMGIGIELGSVHSVFSYFRPRERNPFVLVWFAVVVAVWILGFRWLFARRGAEFLIEHPGLLRGLPQNPTIIRAFYCLVVAVGFAALVCMFIGDVPEITK